MKLSIAGRDEPSYRAPLLSNPVSLNGASHGHATPSEKVSAGGQTELRRPCLHERSDGIRLARFHNVVDAKLGVFEGNQVAYLDGRRNVCNAEVVARAAVNANSDSDV